MNYHLGIANAVRRALAAGMADHYTLHLDGYRISGREWLRTPSCACLPPPSADDRAFWSMRFWAERPHLSPARSKFVE